jgi:predicted nucleic acid-binding protein
LLLAKTTIVIPEIAGYELRRELLRIGSVESIGCLDALSYLIRYLPLTTETMRKAAEFWAEARRQGKPAADDKALDANMILCAQAALIGNPEEQVIIATTNVGHLARFSQAMLWKDI